MNSELLEHYQVTVDSENTKESIHGTFGEVVSSVQGLSLSDCLSILLEHLQLLKQMQASIC